MRLARIGTAGNEIPAVGDAEGRWFDLRSLVSDLNGPVLARDIGRIRESFRTGGLPRVEAVPRFGPPLSHVGKVVCVGLNYGDHARETGATPPSEPILFLKASDTVVGPDDDVLIPRSSSKCDYEVELAVVIGAKARYLPSRDAATAVIAGYAISNDVSEREFQIERSGQWDKGKNCETFNPFGPWILTSDEVPDPQDLALRLWVNGEPRQKGHTADMLFDVYHLVWYVSQFMVLRPGDVINTGTPAGVALASDNIAYLRDGDVVEVEIDGLGRQRQTLRQA